MLSYRIDNCLVSWSHTYKGQWSPFFLPHHIRKFFSLFASLTTAHSYLLRFSFSHTRSFTLRYTYVRIYEKIISSNFRRKQSIKISPTVRHFFLFILTCGEIYLFSASNLIHSLACGYNYGDVLWKFKFVFYAPVWISILSEYFAMIFFEVFLSLILVKKLKIIFRKNLHSHLISISNKSLWKWCLLCMYFVFI